MNIWSQPIALIQKNIRTKLNNCHLTSWPNQWVQGDVSLILFRKHFMAFQGSWSNLTGKKHGNKKSSSQPTLGLVQYHNLLGFLSAPWIANSKWVIGPTPIPTWPELGGFKIHPRCKTLRLGVDQKDFLNNTWKSQGNKLIGVDGSEIRLTSGICSLSQYFAKFDGFEVVQDCFHQQ